MARGALRTLLLVSALPLSAIAVAGAAQGQSGPAWPAPPTVAWPDPPGAAHAAAPAPSPAPATRFRRASDPEEESLPEAAQLPSGPPPRTTRARRKPAPPGVKPGDAVGSLPPAPSAARARPRTAAAAPSNIRCDGAFAMDTSHAKLGRIFGARNVTIQEIDSGGTKTSATVLFPNDAKRRVEIVWHDEAGRKRPSQIVISGQSQWRARGFKIGETLAAVETTNGKPFKLGGFGGGDYRGAARDWSDGKLEALSGGCRLGMRFARGADAPADARGKIDSSDDFMSDDPAVRAVKPVITELMLYYPN